MRKFVLEALVLLVAFALLSMVFPPVSAGDEPQGKPFLALSDRIDDLESSSDDWNTAYGWGDHSAMGYLTSYTETDPIFGASTAAGIGASDVSNWDTAYGWGDHSTEGYLTSYTETDPVFGVSPAGGITSGDISNWDTAFGWGDHALAGYDTTDDSWTGTGDVYTTSGNVGIGTTSPVTRLHVEHNIGGQWAAKVVNPSTTGLGMTVDTGSSDPGYLAFRIRTGDVNRFWVVNDGTAYFSGNVGIGTQSPSEKLDVAGNIHASGTITSGSSITIDGTHDKITASTGTIDFDNENLLTTGKVGIGTAAPIGPFEVKTGNTMGPAVLDQSQTKITYYATNSKDVWQSFTAGKTGKLEIVSLYISTLTNPSETIRIYKGQGTGGTLLYTATSINAPANKWLTHTLTTSIDVTSGSKYTIRLSTSSGSGCYWGLEKTNPYSGGRANFGTSWDCTFKTYVSTAVPELLVSSNGNVGIGTASPTSQLHVVGLPSYSSNAAAVSGGLTVGAFYRNVDNVCVVH